MRAVVIILSIIILLLAVCEGFFRYALFCPPRKRHKGDATDLAPGAQDLFITGAGGLRLHGILVRRGESHDYLLCSHGWRGNAFFAKPLSDAFLAKGWNVLSVDHRAHGGSEGRWCSMGLWESEDLLSWTRKITERDARARIVIWGVSMGASIAMMCADRVPPSVRAIIEDCGYSTLEGEYLFQLKERMRLPPYPLLPLLSFVSRFRLGFSFSEVRPVDHVARSRVPILFIHGDRDHFVDSSMVWENYHAMPGEKQIFIGKGSKHAETIEDHGDEYVSLCLDFAGRHLH